MFTIAIPTASMLGLRTRTPFNFHNLRIKWARARFESEDTPTPPYEPMFPIHQGQLGTQITRVLQGLYSALGMSGSNDVHVDITQKAFMYGTTIFPFK